MKTDPLTHVSHNQPFCEIPVLYKPSFEMTELLSTNGILMVGDDAIDKGTISQIGDDEAMNVEPVRYRSTYNCKLLNHILRVYALNVGCNFSCLLRFLPVVNINWFMLSCYIHLHMN